MPWSAEFEDPIVLPGGGTLITLKDASDHILQLPAAEQALPEWETAIETLIGAAEGRDFLMHARIGMLRAINRDRPAAPASPRRKKAKAYNVIPAKLA